ncbi:MAG: hypothetical protein Q8933_20055 [Bacteroidota bacterium]|nr:hypothetical protein [Bacteroidota bacterium]
MGSELEVKIRKILDYIETETKVTAIIELIHEENINALKNYKKSLLKVFKKMKEEKDAVAN